MSDTVFIVGVAGQDGSYLAEQYLSAGQRVVGVVRRNTEEFQWRIEHLRNDIELVEADVRDMASMQRICRLREPIAIFNFAAHSAVSVSWESPMRTMETNGCGALALLEAIRLSHPDTHLVQAVSSEIFAPSETPLDETSPIGPTNPYGVAKAMSYLFGRLYRERYGLRISNAICFPHESPRRNVAFVSRKITYAVSRIKRGEQRFLELGSLQSLRDWHSARDTVLAYQRMATRINGDDFILASGTVHSIADFAAIAFESVGLIPEDYVREVSQYVRPHDFNRTANTMKAQEVLGWKALLPIKEWIKEMVDVDLGYAGF